MADAAAKAPRQASHHALQCMEIWGGSSAVERSASTPGLDLWVWSRPYQQTGGGGDVHYVSLCGGGLITRLILADVSGHGASVADMARSLRDLMRRNINSKSQSRFVRDLNRQFTELAKMSRFATAVPVLTPDLPHERQGIVPNVVFPTGIDRRDDLGASDRFDVYYGMADNRIGVARLDVPGSLPPGALVDPKRTEDSSQIDSQSQTGSRHVMACIVSKSDNGDIK